jgi:hypothetical protein
MDRLKDLMFVAIYFAACALLALVFLRGLLEVVRYALFL